MLKTQSYLRKYGLAKLSQNYDIKVVNHPSLPLILLNYSYKSPKMSPLARECRGLVLEKHTYNLVARSFLRFFNYSEVREEDNKFDWTNFSCQSKEDGSLINLFNYNKEWIWTTRASFCTDISWINTIRSAIKCTKENKYIEWLNHLNPTFSYTFELCSPFNKVIRNYSTPTLYLLTMFRGEVEFGITETNLSTPPNCSRPSSYCFEDLEDVQNFIAEVLDDQTFEGVVVRDRNNNRLKIKSPSYLVLHKLKNNGQITIPYLLPFVLKHDHELLVYFPEYEKEYQELDDRLNTIHNELEKLWKEVQDIKDQKQFALSILHHPLSPLSCILFNTRKHGCKLEEEWMRSEKVLSKYLESEKVPL